MLDVSAPIARGVKCKICKFTVHVKCQSYIAYCSGVSLCVHMCVSLCVHVCEFVCAVCEFVCACVHVCVGMHECMS